MKLVYFFRPPKLERNLVFLYGNFVDLFFTKLILRGLPENYKNRIIINNFAPQEIFWKKEQVQKAVFRPFSERLDQKFAFRRLVYSGALRKFLAPLELERHSLSMRPKKPWKLEFYSCKVSLWSY